MYSPSDLLKDCAANLLTIDSSRDGRKRGAEQMAIDTDTIALRYEPDTQYLFVDTSFLEGWLLDDGRPATEHLYQNTQYRGHATVRLLKGTGHSAPARSVQVFDMAAISAKRAGGTRRGRAAVRNKAMRETKRDMKAVAEATQLYDEIQMRQLAMGEQGAKAKTLEAQRKLLRDMQATERRINRLMQGLKPVARPRKPRVRLPELTQHIKNLLKQGAMTIQGHKLLVDKGKPTYTELDHLGKEHTLAGMHKESVNRNGKDHTSKIYLEVKKLKKLFPQYRSDARYTHSQSTYIKCLGAKGEVTGITRYCAVFDMLKKEEG